MGLVFHFLFRESTKWWVLVFNELSLRYCIQKNVDRQKKTFFSVILQTFEAYLCNIILWVFEIIKNPLGLIVRQSSLKPFLSLLRKAGLLPGDHRMHSSHSSQCWMVFRYVHTLLFLVTCWGIFELFPVRVLRVFVWT